MQPLETLRQYMQVHKQNIKSMAWLLGLTESNFGIILQGRRRLPLRAIRRAVGLGLDPWVMLRPFPCEERDEAQSAAQDQTHDTRTGDPRPIEKRDTLGD